MQRTADYSGYPHPLLSPPFPPLPSLVPPPLPVMEGIASLDLASLGNIITGVRHLKTGSYFAARGTDIQRVSTFGRPILVKNAKSKYINRIWLERASLKQSSDTHKTPYDRVKRCWERKKCIKASESVNVDVFTSWELGQDHGTRSWSSTCNMADEVDTGQPGEGRLCMELCRSTCRRTPGLLYRRGNRILATTVIRRCPPGWPGVPTFQIAFSCPRAPRARRELTFPPGFDPAPVDGRDGGGGMSDVGYVRGAGTEGKGSRLFGGVDQGVGKGGMSLLEACALSGTIYHSIAPSVAHPAAEHKVLGQGTAILENSPGTGEKLEGDFRSGERRDRDLEDSEFLSIQVNSPACQSHSSLYLSSQSQTSLPLEITSIHRFIAPRMVAPLCKSPLIPRFINHALGTLSSTRSSGTRYAERQHVTGNGRLPVAPFTALMLAVVDFHSAGHFSRRSSIAVTQPLIHSTRPGPEACRTIYILLALAWKVRPPPHLILAVRIYGKPMKVKRGENATAPECKGGGNGRYPKKTRRPAASSGMIPKYDNPGTTPLGTVRLGGRQAA
ncbi:hypothetical protein PR048_024280 [Dryococelus australis]|uniref:Ribosomal protein L2 n=1 Tax=Dryococelus australis TaxID=614101 RepID=A0ABQ9GN47_9NEOP|nr:hypothetical protein PR048_024280 [Dryococelus australis]